MNEARIENCSHKFCFDCIQSWALKSENSCPNCKKKFNKIIYKTVCEDDGIIEIPNKRNDEFEIICFICEDSIEDDDSWSLCHHCSDTSAHDRCLNRKGINPDIEFDWCPNCKDLENCECSICRSSES